MKNYKIIILLISVTYIYSQCFSFDYVFNKTKWFEAKFSEDEKKLGYSNCCYYSFRHLSDDYDTNVCIGLYKEQFDDINKFILTTEEEQEVVINSVDCKSLYIKLGIISLIYILFF